MIQRSFVCMSQHFVANNMAGFEHNVSNEDVMEQVVRDEYLHSCHSKDFKDRNKKPIVGKNRRESGGQISKHKNSVRSLSQLK